MIRRILLRRWIVGLFLLSLFTGLLYGQTFFQELVNTAAGEQAPLMLSLCLAVYGLCLAIPFLPGVELGMALMACFGKWGIFWVFAMTQLALNGTYWFARHRFNPDSPGVQKSQRAFERLKQRPGYRWLSALEKYPELLLLGLLNVPGNTLIGGGGGLAASFGALRLLSPGRFFGVTLMATAPVPLIFWWTH